MTRNLNHGLVDNEPKLARLAAGEPLRVIDLFAGCGGLSLGFQKAGYQILGGVEIDPKAAETLGRNLFQDNDGNDSAHCKPRDITELGPSRFMLEVLRSRDPTNLVDVVIGGPPCQAFARVGRAKLREITNHPEAFLQDDRANLFLNFLEYVEHFRPLAVLMENVQDVMNYGGNNVAEEIASSLRKLGYLPKYTILNSVFYGVPQMRQRLFLIAILAELNIEPTFPKLTHYHEVPSGYDGAYQVALKTIGLFNYESVDFEAPPRPSEDLPGALTAQDALADLPAITTHLEGKMKRGTRSFNELAKYREDIDTSDYAWQMRTWPGFESADGVYDHVTRYLPRDFKIFARMEPGDQYPEAHRLAMRMLAESIEKLERETEERIQEGSDLYSELKRSHVPPYDPGKFPNRWRKMEADRPARTLTAHIGKDTYSHIHYDSRQSRVISVREAARLQSFPDGFEFTGPMNAAFRQIGNAVPPLLGFALAKNIKQLIEARA